MRYLGELFVESVGKHFNEGLEPLRRVESCLFRVEAR
jgi:hypothetical protein